MTKAERKNPDILKANRKKRIAAGSGTKVEEINKLLKMHRQMADMMKAMGKGKGLFGKMGAMAGMGGGMPPDGPGGAAAARPRRRMPGGLPGLPRRHAGRTAGPARRPRRRVPGPARPAEEEVRRDDGPDARPRRPRPSSPRCGRASTTSTRPSSTSSPSASSCTQKVGVYKATHDLPPADPAREKMQVARLRKLAEDADLDPDFAEKFFAFIVKEVIRHHEALRS